MCVVPSAFAWRTFCSGATALWLFSAVRFRRDAGGPLERAVNCIIIFCNLLAGNAKIRLLLGQVAAGRDCRKPQECCAFFDDSYDRMKQISQISHGRLIFCIGSL